MARKVLLIFYIFFYFVQLTSSQLFEILKKYIVVLVYIVVGNISSSPSLT